MKMTFTEHLENRLELLRALDELYRKKEKPTKKDTKSTKKSH